MRCRADVAKEDQVRDMVDATIERFGRLDVLVNSASIWKSTPWPDISEADWDLLNGVVVKGAFFCTKAAGPHLAAHGDGAIVNIVDLSAFRPFCRLPAALGRKGRAAEHDLRLRDRDGAGVRVNAVAPGPVLAPPGFNEAEFAVGADATLLQRWGEAGGRCPHGRLPR